MTPELVAEWARQDEEHRATKQGQKSRASDVEALKKRLATSYGRFGWRIEKWEREADSALPHHFWWFVHNCIAHPMIGVLPVRRTFDFHDYTSRKINRE